MLGNTRVRQLRVQKNRGCNVRTEFAGLKIGKGGAVDETPIACYPPFSEEVESQLTYRKFASVPICKRKAKVFVIFDD